MRRNGLTRLLLLGLVAVTILLVVRIFRSPSNGDSVVYFDDDHEVESLNHVAFKVRDRAVKVEITATGSLQSDDVLAAYPWVIRDEDRSLVWSLDTRKAVRGSGMTTSASEVLTLEPGVYHAYFASFGDPSQPTAPPESFFDKISAMIDSDFARWRHEADHWDFAIRPLADTDRPLIESVDDDELGEHGLVVWSTGPVGNNAVSEYLFEVARPVTFHVRCVGEINRDRLDSGWIEDIESGEHIWDMTTATTEPAGGSLRNRICRQLLEIPEGRYRAIFKTDDDHAFDEWEANPPFDPSFWGLELTLPSRLDEPAVAPFDPWESLPRVVSLTGIGDDQLVSYAFTLDQPMRVLVYALGEGYTSRGRMFDYSWIVGTGDREVWKMTADQTKHAGGSSKNRRAETVLDLDANVAYTVYYKTDGSHSYPDWNEDPPLHPNQWGVTIFALDPDFIPRVDPPSVSSHPATKPGFAHSSETPLVSMQSIGNDMKVSRQFTLEENSNVHVYALGEMTRDGRYDWGWIVSLETGAVVWEMRRENSISAGGTSKNRLVDVIIELPAGRYEAHYVTDDSHAYPDFRYGGAPDNPTAWGLSVQLVEKGEQDQ